MVSLWVIISISINLYLTLQKVIVVAIRGTASVTDVLTNAAAKMETFMVSQRNSTNIVEYDRLCWKNDVVIIEQSIGSAE